MNVSGLKLQDNVRFVVILIVLAADEIHVAATKPEVNVATAAKVAVAGVWCFLNCF